MMKSALKIPLRLPFHYGWTVVALSFLATLVAAGMRAAGPVLIQSFEVEFGWSIAQISVALGLSLLMFGLAAPFGGRMLDRYGARAVLLVSFTIALGSLIAMQWMTALWQLILIWSIILPLSLGSTAGVLGVTVATRWFDQRRGLALGILNTSVSTGQFIFIPALMALVLAFGWRSGIILLIGAGLLMLPLLYFLMRDDPEQIGLQPYGAVPQASGPADTAVGTRAPESKGLIAIGTLVRHRVFWLLAGSHFVCGATASGLVGSHLLRYSVDKGLPEVSAAAAVGVMALVNFIGVIAAGWLVDRVDPRRVLTVVFAVRGLSLFILPFVRDVQMLFIFAVIFGLFWFASAPPVAMLLGITFGKRSVGVAYGWIFVVHQIGSSLMAIGAGNLRVWLGAYDMAFVIGGIIGLMGGALALALPAHKPGAVGGVPSALAAAATRSTAS